MTFFDVVKTFRIVKINDNFILINKTFIENIS